MNQINRFFVTWHVALVKVNMKIFVINLFCEADEWFTLDTSKQVFTFFMIFVNWKVKTKCMSSESELVIINITQNVVVLRNTKLFSFVCWNSLSGNFRQLANLQTKHGEYNNCTLVVLVHKIQIEHKNTWKFWF